MRKWRASEVSVRERPPSHQWGFGWWWESTVQKWFTLIVSRGWPTTTLAAPGDESKVLCKTLNKVLWWDRKQWVYRGGGEISIGTVVLGQARAIPSTVPRLWRQVKAGQKRLHVFPWILSWTLSTLRLKGIWARGGGVVFVYEQPLSHSCRLMQIFSLKMVRFRLDTRKCIFLH